MLMIGDQPFTRDNRPIVYFIQPPCEFASFKSHYREML